VTVTNTPEEGRITDDGIARMRERLNVPFGRAKPPHNRCAAADTFRHFAWGYGDDNPLFTDEDYARGTRWGGLVAAPMYLLTMGENEVGPLPRDVRERSRGALRGVHLFNAGTKVEFFRPIRVGDRIAESIRLVDVTERTSRFAGGNRSVISYNEHVYQHVASRDVYARRLSWYVHSEREAARSAGRDASIPEPDYELDELEEIHQKLLAESARGAKPRYWDDVSVGEVIGPLHKGPMTVSDVICMHIGLGTGGEYGWGPLRLAAQRRAEMPSFYTRNQFGVWDVVQRVHWDEAWARQIGAVRPYDYGQTRQMWIAHLLTDWIGDDGWLSWFECEFRKFNYVGDYSIVSGTVTGLPAPGAVDIDVAIVNQRQEQTTTGRAQVLLPTRDSAVALPDSPDPPREVVVRQRAAGIEGAG
jgi:acyl dehydratase